MAYVAILLLMLVALSITGWPLLSSSRRLRPEASGAASPADDLMARRDATYRAIKELDFEHELGNLSESDYQELRDRYRTRAAAVLQELESVLASAGPSPAAVEASPQGSLPCPHGSQPTEPSDGYCWSCGAKLEGRCSACGHALAPGDNFCASCGARREGQA
ncbi:MAG: zinc ribbon domain-containing protein [Chloroflexi bacterium]|nr:zinc ribbon domain-containing protein [Chloroflexota bacterium]